MSNPRHLDWRAPRSEGAPDTLEDWLQNNYPRRSNRDLADEMADMGYQGVTPNAIRRKGEMMGLRKVGLAPVTPEFIKDTTEPASAFDWRATVRAAIALQEQRKAFASDTAGETIIRLATNRPIALCFSGDWHLGSGSTDHAMWQEDIEFLLNTPDLYYAVLGDEYENIRTFKTLQAVIAQVLPVDLQRRVMEAVTTELASKGKLLWTTWGNHGDEFDERLIGESLTADFRRAQTVPHLGSLGLIRLQVGSEEYTILATHKAGHKSAFNALHGAKRLYQTVYPADVVVTAHDHAPAHEEYNHYAMARDMGRGFGGTSWLVACSTYKTQASNDWAARRYGRAILKRETAVLYPDEHRIEMFDSAEAAVRRVQESAYVIPKEA